MTATILIAAASLDIFLLVFWFAKVIPTAKGALATAHGALGAMRDPQLDELTRERRVQAAGISLLAYSGSLIVRSLAALIGAALPIFAADWIGVVPRVETLAFMVRWDVILVATGLITAGYLGRILLWPR
jgi:hypothetical protein